MNFKKEEKLLADIKEAVKKRAVGKNVAVLDADGTLWEEDINHILLEHQLKKGKKELEPLLGDFYQKQHRDKLCEEFVKKQKGVSLESFKKEAKEALQASPLHIFPFQKKLLSFLKKENIKICVVTASIQWLVELAVKRYDLPIDQVLGVQTKITDGMISDQILKPAPVRQDKGAVFLQVYKKESCLLVGGNSLTDLSLLQMAQLSFVVNSALPDNIIFSSEQKMKHLAIQNKWFVFERV